MLGNIPGNVIIHVKMFDCQVKTRSSVYFIYNLLYIFFY